MRVHSRRRSSIPVWSRAVSGFANEPVTQWQPPMAERASLLSRVRLDVDILSADAVAPEPVLTKTLVPIRHMVMLVSPEAELRKHLKACLCDHPKLRLLEATSPTAAASLARELAVHLIITDAKASTVMRALPEVRTILLADQPTHEGMAGRRSRQHVMQRPFSAETLKATVLLLLQESAAS